MRSLIIRLIGTAILLYFVYGETGWATTAVLILMTFGIEAGNLAIDNIKRRLNLQSLFERLGGR